MSYNFTNQERKDTVARLLQVSKFKSYSITEKVELLKVHFLYFLDLPDSEVESYIANLSH